MKAIRDFAGSDSAKWAATLATQFKRVAVLPFVFEGSCCPTGRGCARRKFAEGLTQHSIEDVL